MLICVVLLAMVFLPVIGSSHNGSKMDKSLLYRISAVRAYEGRYCDVFAAQIEDGRHDLKSWKGLKFYFFWIGIVAALMMLETHLSGYDYHMRYCGCGNACRRYEL